jgi:hypothetical protein
MRFEQNGGFPLQSIEFCEISKALRSTVCSVCQLKVGVDVVEVETSIFTSLIYSEKNSRRTSTIVLYNGGNTHKKHKETVHLSAELMHK